MKRWSFLFTAMLVSVSLLGQARKKKVVYIIADGIPAATLEKVNTPNMDAIAKQGTYVHAYVGGEKGGYSQTPTISAVGYNSLLTGVWVNKHNVPDNSILAPNYNYGTIFRFFKTAYPDKKIGIFSSWQDNRTKLIGEGLPQTGHIKMDIVADGYELDHTNFPHDKESAYMHLIDEKVSIEAANSIREQAPDLSWIYLEYTDDMGHRYGYSPQFYKAIELMDLQVGRVWEAIQYREKTFNEEWMIVITTDHGRDSNTGSGHGGQSAGERSTWITTNVKLDPYFKTTEPGIVDIMPTIARYLDVRIPEENAREVDGVPMIGKVSLISPLMTKEDNKLDIKWTPLEKKGKVKVWLTTTNNFKTGGKDTHQLVKTASLKDGQVTVDVSKYPSDFYKVVLEGRNNSVNRWLIIKTAK
jgi:hypothetical protein